MADGWVAAVVEDLAAAKRAGTDFDSAWRAAMTGQPPRLAELGVPRTQVDTLLDQTAASGLGWFRGVCEAAWVDAPSLMGGPSKLRGLRAALETGDVSEERPQHVRVRGARRVPA